MVVRVALWVLPFRVFRRILLWRGGPRAKNRTHSAERIAWAVAAASQCVPHATCLTKAVAAKFLLVRAGLPALLHIGVMRDGEGHFKAHAWVEYQGRILVGEQAAGEFTPLLAC